MRNHARPQTGYKTCPLEGGGVAPIQLTRSLHTGCRVQGPSQGLQYWLALFELSELSETVRSEFALLAGAAGN